MGAHVRAERRVLAVGSLSKLVTFSAVQAKVLVVGSGVRGGLLFVDVVVGGVFDVVTVDTRGVGCAVSSDPVSVRCVVGARPESMVALMRWSDTRCEVEVSATVLEAPVGLWGRKVSRSLLAVSFVDVFAPQDSFRLELVR